MAAVATRSRSRRSPSRGSAGHRQRISSTPSDGAELSEPEEEAGPSSELRQHQELVCPASPGLVPIEGALSQLPSSNSFYLDPLRCVPGNNAGQFACDQLTANDVFSRSKSLIKRPSTMVMSNSDAMNQVAQALQSASSNQESVLRNRRQAIVPPKLATDASTSDGEGPTTGQLVDLEEPSGPANDEEATVRALRRKRSGGGAAAGSPDVREHQLRRARADKGDQIGVASEETTLRRHSGGQQLPTFFIESDRDAQVRLDSMRGDVERTNLRRRPDSQATNAESIVSSGSSTNLS